MRPSLVLGALLTALFAWCPLSATAQTWGTVSGTVVDANDDTTLPGVTVLVAGTNYGTATDAEGRYALRVPAGTYALRFSAVGFTTRRDSITVRTDETTTLDVALAPSVTQMDEVTVEDDRGSREAGVYRVDPQDVQNMPTPFKDGLRALKVVPGVATNNELSQQYSVRGGGYNENLIFLNGFEVFLPFRPRQGEQEGLGLLNPDLASDITFYTGGFPARYGGKLASALDVQYATPDNQPLSGSASVSMLDASIHAESSALDDRLSWTAGIRRAQPGRFFGTQDLKGDYDPRFTDVQLFGTYAISERVSLEALGIHADHTFALQPRERETYFGMISLNPEVPSDLNVLWSQLNGAREDGYRTSLGGVRLHTNPSRRLKVAHEVSYFRTQETENFDIVGDAQIFAVNATNGDWTQQEGRNRNINFADNSVEVQTLTGGGRYQYLLNRHALESGWHLRGLRFDDRLDEETIIEDVSNENPDIVVQDLEDRATLDEAQVGGYLQNAFDVLPERDRLIVTAGVRADYFSLNDETTVSPRLSARFQYNDRLTVNGSWGIYNQKPAYRELRGTPQSGQRIEDALNRDLRSQRSMQTVLGGAYFFPQRRLYLRVEGYYKDIDNIISYTIDDIRVEYSGENDADGFIYGGDVQLRGEFVPGLESWFNYSYMVARETFRPPFQGEYNQGTLARPTDQRHTFSAFVQDYVPGDKTWKLHLRMLYGSGLPYTPPAPGPETEGGLETRVPGPRMSARLPAYRRVDVGATKQIDVTDTGSRSPVRLDLTIELLNMFDMDNTVTYTWQQTGTDFTRIPKRLTPRTLNARARLTF